MLTPADFHLPRLRYMALRPYPPDEFERTNRWMRSWDLIPEGASYAQLVEHRVGAAG
jgi:NitT/TauT family transport system substrate-binding protein